jgi:hypothetical protein
VKTETTTHVTAPTEFVEADGIRFAHRRFGQDTGIPLVFLQHFRGVSTTGILFPSSPAV